MQKHIYEVLKYTISSWNCNLLSGSKIINNDKYKWFSWFHLVKLNFVYDVFALLEFLLIILGK
jgi:hypothetical protein